MRPVSLGMLPLYPGDMVFAMYAKGQKIMRNVKTMNHDGAITETEEEVTPSKPSGNRKQRRAMKSANG